MQSTRTAGWTGTLLRGSKHHARRSMTFFLLFSPSFHVPISLVIERTL